MRSERRRRHASPITPKNVSQASPATVATPLLALQKDDAPKVLLPEAVAKSMKAKTSYWKARIPWYPEGCFGPYRSPNIGYSRRELLADGLVHALGLLGFGVASWRLLWTLDPDLPADLRAAIVTYTVSIMTMLICSSMWNGLAWDRGHRRLLQLADHIGILALIVGSYCPMMVMADCPALLRFVWALACISAAIKATGSSLDTEVLHVLCFLGMGWSVVVVWEEFWTNFSPWAKSQCVLAGVLYSTGLLPWKFNRLEGHNALWHVHVLAASAAYCSVVHYEVSQSSAWVRAPA